MIYFIGGSRKRPEVIAHEIQMSGNSSANVDGWRLLLFTEKVKPRDTHFVFIREKQKL